MISADGSPVFVLSEQSNATPLYVCNTRGHEIFTNGTAEGGGRTKTDWVAINDCPGDEAGVETRSVFAFDGTAEEGFDDIVTVV